MYKDGWNQSIQLIIQLILETIVWSQDGWIAARSANATTILTLSFHKIQSNESELYLFGAVPLLVPRGLTTMNAQKEKVVRELDTNIYKIMDSYRMLLKKSQVSTVGEMNTHQELQVETATESIVSSEMCLCSYWFWDLFEFCVDLLPGISC